MDRLGLDKEHGSAPGASAAKMSTMRRLTIAAGLALAALFGAGAANASLIGMGYVSYDVTNPGSTGQFDIVNLTGPNSDPAGFSDFPVTNSVDFTNLSLTVTYSDGSVQSFGSSYFTLSTDGLSYDGTALSISGTNPQPVEAVLTGDFDVTSLLLNDGTTPIISNAFTATILDPSGNLNDGDLAVIYGVPEPASAILLAGGLLGLFVLRGRLRGGTGLRPALPLGAAAVILGAAALLPPDAQASTAVSLATATAPSAGVAGVSYVNVTAQGLPAGTTAASVTVRLAPSCAAASAGSVTGEVDTAASSVVTVVGSSRRIQFQLPATLLKATYSVAISGTTSGTSFASTNCASVAVGATPVPGDPLTGSGIVSRTANTYNSLMVSTQATTITAESNWGLPSTAAAPLDTFEGTLTLSPITAAGYFSVYYDLNNLTNHGHNVTGYNTLPAFSFQFVQNGSYLIPVTQGWYVTGGTYWNYIIGVGRAWSETTDNGYTRASFPFAIVQVGQNCLHNGVMTFLFNKNASPKISHVAYQIDAEGCPTFQFDMAGQLAATYTPATVPNDAAIETAEATEVTNRLPVKPFTALATDFPSSGINTSAILAQYTYPNSVTTYGVVINGINYNSGCATRHTSSTSPSTPNGLGYYPYCSEMRMPSYSTAKSAFASLGMMRLGELYGSGVYTQDISTWVPQYVDGGVWTNVTFGNASDMATGNYISSGYEVDENSSTTTTFLNATSYASKIADAITPFPHKVAPGTTWVYQSVASFIETQAENAYLKSQQGSSADLFTMMKTDVYTPLNMSQGFMVTERTDNAQNPSTSGAITGAPAGYFGLFYNIDDMAKIGSFIDAGTGVINGNQVIDPTRLQDALYKTSNPGLTVPCAVTTCNSSNLYDWHFVYNHNFWGKVVTNAEYSTIHCTTYPTIPFMSGYGGITIMMFPNGATYYVQSDAYEFWIDAAITQIAKLSPICS